MEKSKNNGNNTSFIDVYFLGISSVISGSFTFWNIGFAFGFWEFCFTTLFISIAYFLLVMCLAEMISGSYGFSRVTMGPYLGFLIGCFDSMSIIVFIAILLRSACYFITYSVGPSAPLNYDPLWWFLLYVACLLVMIPLGRWHFRFISVMGVISVALVIIFALATIPNQNFDQNVIQQDRHAFFAAGGMSSFMQLMPISTWMYIGIDLICLVCDDTADAMHVVPKALVASMLTLIVLALLLIVTTAANAPGLASLSAVAIPLNPGFTSSFKISDRMATIISIPTIIINIYAVIYAYGRQVCALSRSKLLPSFLSWTTSSNVPYMAVICSSLLGYSILLGLYYNDSDMQLTLNYLFNAAQMGSFSVYIVSFLSFIIFRYKYSSLQRHFVNSLGIPSAVIGIIIFLFAFIGVAFFQEDGYRSVTYYAVFVAAVSVYYFGYARYNQCFSPEEQSILFAAYIIKTNGRKRTMWSRIGRKILGVVDRVDPRHHLSDWMSSTFSFSQRGLQSQSRGSNSSGNNSRGSPRRLSMRKDLTVAGAHSAAIDAAVIAASDTPEAVDIQAGSSKASSKRNRLFRSSSSSKKDGRQSKETVEEAVSPTVTMMSSSVNGTASTAAALGVNDDVTLFHASELDESINEKVMLKASNTSVKNRNADPQGSLRVVPVDDNIFD